MRAQSTSPEQAPLTVPAPALPVLANAAAEGAAVPESTARPSRAERRAAARGRRVTDPAPSPVVRGRGRTLVHDRSRYAVRRRG
ncbi:hypothetical protein [Cryptosporangium minutisporangium]|uniref:Uncharacterized protein n=1 Tax=Cryptosporangium minutisporangium TaxID=113569 RepID=A0ABP6SXC2_9ACTN